MSNVLRLAIVDPSDPTRDSLKTMLLGMDRVWLEAECSRYEFFADVVAQTHPDIGIVALDQDPDKALDLVARLNETSPECAILVVSASTDGKLILRAMRAGAKEFLNAPVRLQDLLDSLDRIADRRFGR
ncbi:MAG TPA: response regulator, partial [Pirellulales bacterium]|nr:response regulator [Pirellulales bacterium]